jgi:uncharacterized protein YodC (DUF2158 family)
MSKTKTQPKAVLQIGSVVQLKSGGNKFTVIGVDAYKSSLTVVWSSNNGNVGKAEVPAVAFNIIKY